jgi:Coenzyme PQQ synthesis protein D (PqqD)
VTAAAPLYARAKSLIEAEIGEGIVALDADGGECFGFNAVAASVWRLIEQPRSQDAIEAALIEEYDVAPEQCRAEVGELLTDLQSRGLVRRA